MAHAKILTDTNLRATLAILKEPRERVMVLLSSKAGLRAVEIATLTWGCIRENDTVMELVSTKGGKPRTVPISSHLREALQAYRAECKHTNDRDLVFVSRHAKPRTPLSANAVAAWFRDLYVRRLGSAGKGLALIQAGGPSHRKRHARRHWPAARSGTSRTCSGMPA